MAIADIRAVGFETGDLTEASSTSGTLSVQGTTKRTDAYALKVNPSASTGKFFIRALDGAGAPTSIARTAETFYTFYVRIATLPGGTTELAIVNGTSAVVTLNCTSGGALTLVGSTTSSTIATLSTNTWYRIDIRCTSNGTSGAKVDGGTEQTCTANNVTQVELQLGNSTAATMEVYYDDVVIGTTSPAGPVEVRYIGADGNGTDATGWDIGGTGTTYTEVDERPHDSTTTYWSGFFINDVRGVTLQSTATAGIVGTIFSVTAFAITKDIGTGGTAKTRLRSGSSTSDTTASSPGATFGMRAKMSTTDPATSAAWTASGVDGAQTAVVNGAGQQMYATLLGAMVCCDGVAAGGAGQPTMRRFGGVPYAAASPHSPVSVW